MDIAELQTKLAPVFARHAGEIAAAYLFGSTAAGTAHERSDIDIAILMRASDKTRAAAVKVSLYADICRKLGRNEIDLVILSHDGNIILNDEVIRKGKVLFAADRETMDSFELTILHRCLDFKFQRQLAMGV